jgi:hypothetical protein
MNPLFPSALSIGRALGRVPFMQEPLLSRPPPLFWNHTGDTFTVGCAPETIRCTNLGGLVAGERVNLERRVWWAFETLRCLCGSLQVPQAPPAYVFCDITVSICPSVCGWAPLHVPFLLRAAPSPSV